MIALAPAVAAADRVEGTRSSKLVETRHRVDVTVDHAKASLRVRRTVHNGGERHDQALFWIDVPWSAVATGLRTLGELRGKPKWFAGELMEAELAAERYLELTGIGGYYPKDPALLSWRDQTQLALQVFPVAPKSPKTVEYTLTMPVEYDEGRYVFELPPLGTDKRPAEVSVTPAHRLDQILIDGVPVGRGATFEADEFRTIELKRRDPPMLDARLAVANTGDRFVVQYQIALASQLSKVPRNASVVVVLDASRSLESYELEDGVAATQAYLSHFKGLHARAEVVTFDRTAQRRYGKMRAAEAVVTDLESFDAEKRGNGSSVDEALAKAGAILGREPKRRPRRIVVITDARTRDGFSAKRLATLAKRSGAIVHIGTLSTGGGAELERDDSHKWAEAARVTGGLAWGGSASSWDDDRDAMREAYLEWARPVRIDNAEAEGKIGSDLELPFTLPEGFGSSLLTVMDNKVPSVIVTGELWSRPVREVTTPSKTHGDLWSALVFGTEELDALEEDEMMTLALRGRAVSPVTSYLAIEPGVRPSTEGLTELEGSGGGGTGEGTIGLGSVGLIGHGGGGGPIVSPREFLEMATREAADACGIDETSPVKVELQTTLAEIVEIDGVELGDGSDAIRERCVAEKLWAVELQSNFRSTEFKRWTVEA